jgi:hypothetical protein
MVLKNKTARRLSKLAQRMQSRKNGNNNTNDGTMVKGSGALIGGGGAFASLTLNVEPWMPLFPARSVKTLRYSTNIQLASSGGVPNTYVFRANDLFDPDATGTGHQPMGFDQMMVQYNHFCVTKAKIKVIFKAISAAKMTVAVRLDGAATALTVIDQIVEFGASVIDYLDATSVNGDQKLLWLAVDVAKHMGISKDALTASPNQRGTVSASPTELTYFHVTVFDAAAQSGTCNIDVILEQEAYFLEPRDQATSSKLQRRACDDEKDFGFVCKPKTTLSVCGCSCGH